MVLHSQGQCPGGKAADGSQDAAAHFVSKRNDLWASIEGRLTRDTDLAVVDRLWNSHVAAWYEDGKDDPKLALLRFDLQRAEIRLDASSIVAGPKVWPLASTIPRRATRTTWLPSSCSPHQPDTGPEVRYLLTCSSGVRCRYQVPVKCQSA